MGRWLITQKDDVQFAAESLDELKKMATEGKLGLGDMVQPPESNEWVYAAEISQLEGLLPKDDDSEEIDFAYRGTGGTAVAMALGALFTLVFVTMTATSIFLYTQIPFEQQGLFVGDGAVSYSEMVSTADSIMLDSPNDGGKTLLTIPKDTVVTLLAKRKTLYKVRLKDGTEGWVQLADMLPMYRLGDESVNEEKDPLFNPDRYVIVSNANWLQLDRKDEKLTVFRFEMQNQSKYPMTDLVLLATIKDSKGNEVESLEIPIEGIIPPLAKTLVGTLNPDGTNDEDVPRLLTRFSFEDLVEEDPDLELRYSDGVEVLMEAEEFTEANIDLIELRAVPMKEAGHG